VGQKQLVPDAHLPKKLTQMNTTEEAMVYGVANITTDKRTEFQVHLSDGETEPTICRIDDTDCLANQVEIESCGISSNGQMLFKTELSICLITFEAW
jgi:spore germination cell wall hydrolase CwlJ-like protein